jgi:polyhydroxyalkanoate synthase
MMSVLDRALHAQIVHWTLSLPPRAAMSAFLDWASCIAFSPGKQAQLLHTAQRKWLRLVMHVQVALKTATRAACCIETLPQDRRFNEPAGAKQPYSVFNQSFVLQQQCRHHPTTGVADVTTQSERVAACAARQWLLALSIVEHLAIGAEIAIMRVRIERRLRLLDRTPILLSARGDFADKADVAIGIGAALAIEFIDRVTIGKRRA